MLQWFKYSKLQRKSWVWYIMSACANSSSSCLETAHVSDPCNIIQTKVEKKNYFSVVLPVNRISLYFSVSADTLPSLNTLRTLKRTHPDCSSRSMHLWQVQTHGYHNFFHVHPSPLYTYHTYGLATETRPVTLIPQIIPSCVFCLCNYR